MDSPPPQNEAKLYGLMNTTVVTCTHRVPVTFELTRPPEKDPVCNPATCDELKNSTFTISKRKPVLKWQSHWLESLKVGEGLAVSLEAVTPQYSIVRKLSGLTENTLPLVTGKSPEQDVLFIAKLQRSLTTHPQQSAKTQRPN